MNSHFSKFIVISLVTLSCTSLNAAELKVNVIGIAINSGPIGCSLFNSDEGFPMDGSKGKQIWVEPNATKVTCEYKDLNPGKYAVSVMQDTNSNKKVDTNIVGIPKELWGVSNNVRPSFRAPKFSEASFSIQENGDNNIEVEIAK